MHFAIKDSYVFIKIKTTNVNNTLLYEPKAWCIFIFKNSY